MAPKRASNAGKRRNGSDGTRTRDLRRDRCPRLATLSGYGSVLAAPIGKRKARIMRAFGGRRIFAITAN
jgi:hypothetical protein